MSAVTSSFAALKPALRARFDTDGQKVRFWWRDDDAMQPHPALALFSGLAREHDFNLGVAVIMRPCSTTFAEYINQLPNVELLIHGWSHECAVEGIKQEFSRTCFHASIEAARKAHEKALEMLAWDRLCRILVPPWNSLDPLFFDHLQDLGYQGVSMFGESVSNIWNARHPEPFKRVDVHVDVIDWVQSRIYDSAAIENRLVPLLGSRHQGPIGIMTHHRNWPLETMDLMKRLLDTLHESEAVEFVSPLGIFH